MTKVRARGEKVRQFIISKVEGHPGDIAAITAKRFDLSRQAVNRHLSLLVKEDALEARGATRSRTYKLKRDQVWLGEFEVTPDLAEDVIWRTEVEPRISGLPENVLDLWHYSFTEIFNNAIDHSESARIAVEINRTAAVTDIMVKDDGVGIFRKIQQELGLLDERHSVLELAKGKLTTDPANHTGEGIFFTSRMVDKFDILSGGVFFTHDIAEDEDWALETSSNSSGTFVFMRVNNHTSRTCARVFRKFTTGDDLGFSKTIVPVELAQYGDELLVSRSQAKRMLARIDRFTSVVFDFEGVSSIGQAFSDQVFRVFANAHPHIELSIVNENAAVGAMIKRVTAAKTTD
jgi:anti-sigma regulatory factor (Ser/Thr protein kinase)